jgi:DNA-binding CsgD family transcriptional regulator
VGKASQETVNAMLQVVQHGSRASFRRRVIDAMQSLVPAPVAFFCLGTHDALAYTDATRVVDGALAPMASAPQGTEASARPKLSQAFGIAATDVVATPRRAYLATELYPDAERMKLPYFKDHAALAKTTEAMLVFFHEGGVLFGLGGLERRAADPPFTPDDVAVLEGLAPFIVAGTRSQLAYDELAREASALRALGRVTGTLYVIDRDAKRILWAADRERGLDWAEDVLALEDGLVIAAEKSLDSRARGEALPTPPRLPNGVLVAVAKIDGDPVFGGARCAVVRVEPADGKPPAMEGLSRREREIARLLVAGYSGVNVAAIAGLSENTVRTYVRRLYQKLAVNNRADLVRKLVAPEPKLPSKSPSSLVAPPPDSSLAHGDDTLD